MAKIKYSALVSGMRGKLNGSVASHNRGGDYLRNKVTPVNPNTTFQQAIRSQLSVKSQAWRALTAAQRLAWNGAVGNFSKTDIFGDLRNPTGKNLYARLNLNLYSIGVAAISAPPLPSAVSQITGATVASTIAEVNLSWSSGVIPAGHTWLIEATAPQSAGVSFVKSEYRIITTLPAADATPTDVFTQYNAKFGAPIVGTKIFIRITPILIASGIKGTPVTAVSITV